MYYRVLFLSLYWNAIETLQQIQPVEENATNDFTVVNCVNAIGKMHFHQEQNVEIISPDSVYNGFEDFGTVIRSTSADFKYPDFRRTLTKYAVIFLEGTNEYEKDLRTLSTLKRSHPQGRFIIAFKSEIDPSRSPDLEYLNKMINYLASIERWNIAILMNQEQSGRIKIYTYTLYSPDDCSRTPKLLELGNCDNAETLSNLFPAFVNFYKCYIQMFVAHSPPQVVITQKDDEITDFHGIEPNVVKSILGKLNATAKAFLSYNGTIMRRAVQTRAVDLAWSNMLQYEFEGTIWTQSYVFVQSVLVIPRSRLMPQWMNLILPFQAEVWTALGMIIGIHLVIKLLIPPIRRQFPVEWMLASFFGSGISKLPTRISQRLYIAYWLIVGYIVTQCYLGSLTGFFASPGQYRPIQTLAEVEQSNIVVGGLPTMKAQFEKMNPGIYRNFKVFTNPEYFGNIVTLKVVKSGVATFAPRPVIMNITKGQEMDFNLVPEHISFYPMAIMLPNSSYILEGCNRIICQILAAGLVQFWEQYEAWEMNKYAATSRSQDDDYQTSLKHLGAVFVILGIGLCIGCIVFGVELTLMKYFIK